MDFGYEQMTLSLYTFNYTFLIYTFNYYSISISIVINKVYFDNPNSIV